MQAPVKAFKTIVSRKTPGKKYYNPGYSTESRKRSNKTKEFNQLVLHLGKLVQADVFGIANDKLGFATIDRNRIQVYREGNIWIAAA